MNTISKTGSMPNSTAGNYKDYITNKLGSTLKYIDKLISSKLDKSGGDMTGDINMNQNRIVNIKHPPESENEAVSKKFCEENTKNLEETLIKNIDGKLNTIKNEFMGHIYILDRELCADFKMYLRILKMSTFSSDDISGTKLMQICEVIFNTLENSFFYDYIKSFIPFQAKYGELVRIMLRYTDAYKTPENPHPEFHQGLHPILFNYIIDLKYFILAIIKEIPEPIFKKLKKNLKDNGLIETPEDNTPLMKIRRFINKTKTKNSNDPEYELLVEKSIMIVELGFQYVPDAFLAALTMHI